MLSLDACFYCLVFVVLFCSDSLMHKCLFGFTVLFLIEFVVVLLCSDSVCSA